jgi:hypothetical protein
MTPAQEWEKKRKQRESGSVSAADWIKWAKSYTRGLPRGPWREHCETHIRFVERQVSNGRA